MKGGTGRRAGGDGWWARMALRRLLRAGDRGDQDATDAVWDRWLAAPADELWAALTRWHRPHSVDGRSRVALGEPADPADVARAACLTGHPVMTIARAAILAGDQDVVDAACAAATTDEDLAAFCAGHHLAPADPHRAAVFFLLTGQLENYRLTDPDHSLAGLAYRTAGQEERARIRARAAAEPDLVRVLAETVRKDRLTGVTDEEARYLVDSFAGRRDWAALWELAKDLPVLHAVAAVSRFDGWRPADHDLFDLLAQADLAALTASRAAVSTPWTARADLPAGGTGGSMTSDGLHLAVRTANTVTVFAFPGGKPKVVRRRVNGDVRAVVLLDGGELVTAMSGHLECGDTVRTAVTGLVSELGVMPTGFVTLSPGTHAKLRLYGYPAASGARTIQVGRLHDVHYRLGAPAVSPPHPWTMATDARTGRIALAGDGFLHLTRKPNMLRKVTSTPFRPGPYPSLTFCGPNQLAGVDEHRVLRAWRRDGKDLPVVAERQLGSFTGPACPVYLADAGVVAVLDGDGARRRVRYLDALTLDDLPVPAAIADLDPAFMCGGGGRLALGGDRWVVVTDARFRWQLTELAYRPLAGATPVDARVVRAQLQAKPTDPRARPFLELLYDCLVARFGVDVALGGTDPLAVLADDIALGEGE